MVNGVTRSNDSPFTDIAPDWPTPGWALRWNRSGQQSSKPTNKQANQNPEDMPGWQSWTWQWLEYTPPGWHPQRWWQGSCPPAPGRASCSGEHSAVWSARLWAGSQWRRWGAPLDGTPGPRLPWALCRTQYLPHLVEHLDGKQYPLQ